MNKEYIKVTEDLFISIESEKIIESLMNSILRTGRPKLTYDTNIGVVLSEVLDNEFDSLYKYAKLVIEALHKHEFYGAYMITSIMGSIIKELDISNTYFEIAKFIKIALGVFHVEATNKKDIE